MAGRGGGGDYRRPVAPPPQVTTGTPRDGVTQYEGTGGSVAHTTSAQGSGYNNPDLVINTGGVAKYRRNRNTCEIIGLESPELVHKTSDAGSGAGTLTVTTFDTTTRSDSARIRLTNSTGNTLQVLGCSIRGYPVERLSGDEGFLHDAFVDYEAIQKDGEIVIEYGNNYIINAAQCKMVANFLWKNNTTKRHMYTVPIPGMASYFEPGEWYTLRLGSAGTQEYIDAVVECFAVRCQLAPGSVGRTSVTFRVVQRNFTDDSNAVTRYLASGGQVRVNNQPWVAIASSTDNRPANYYCDGTDDQVEINTAITNLKNAYGGGTVHLGRGTFNISTVVSLLDNIKIEGEGPGATVLSRNSTWHGFYTNGSAAAYVSNVNVSNMTITKVDTNTANTYSLIYLSYTKDSTIENVEFKNYGQYGIYANYGTGVKINKCSFTHSGTQMTASTNVHGIYFQSNNNYCLIDSCTFIDTSIRSTGAAKIFAIRIASASNFIVSNCIVTNSVNPATSGACVGVSYLACKWGAVNNCNISYLGSAASPLVSYGIYEEDGTSENMSIKNNVITNNRRYGIYDQGYRSAVSGNYCYSNGSSTALINTGDHYYSGGASAMANINSWQ